DHNLTAAPASQPIWPWLTLAAVLLLPLDVAARRLQLTRRDWMRVWKRVTSNEQRATNEEKTQPERPPGMAQLLHAKEQRVTRRPSAGAGALRTDEQETPVESVPDMGESPPVDIPATI